MKITRLSAEMIVANHGAALDWYRRLLGRPPDEQPMDGLVEWQLTETGWLQVFAHPDQAGGSAMTIGVDDLDNYAEALAGRGLSRKT